MATSIIRFFFAALVWSVFCACGHGAQNAVELDTAALSNAIEQQLAAAKKPGAAVALTQGGRLLWSQGFGWADLAANRRATDATVFHLASVSKTVVAVALMQLWEQGRFQLDDDINAALPFAVRNPHFPQAPITYRQLMTHTSSIIDNVEIAADLYRFGEGAPMTLADYCSAYLSPGGALYDAQNNFGGHPPGTLWNYSNTATALAAFLVEAIARMDFAEYCRIHIFAPLGMHAASWRWMDFAEIDLAMPYAYDDGEFIAYGHYSYPDYPSGSLHTSAPQLALFLMAAAGDGSLNGIRLLATAGADEIKRIAFPELAPEQGLFWQYAEVDATTVFGHTGGERGAATLMFYRPEDQVGVVVLTNGEWTGGPEDQALNAIVKLLFEAVR